MGTLLDKAMLAAKQRPADEQDEIARIVLAIIGDEAPPVALSEDDIATPQNPPLIRRPAASSLAMPRWRRFGGNTAFETAVHATGPGRA